MLRRKITLPEVPIYLQTHIEFLDHHINYLEKIKLTLNISPEDKAQYLHDIFGHQAKVVEPLLLEAIYQYFSILKKLYEPLAEIATSLTATTLEATKRVSIAATLKLFLTFIGTGFIEILNKLDVKFPPQSYKILTDQDFTKSIIHCLDEHLPQDQYAILASLIKFNKLLRGAAKKVRIKNSNQLMTTPDIAITYTLHFQSHLQERSKILLALSKKVCGNEKMQVIEERYKKDPNKFKEEQQALSQRFLDDHHKELRQKQTENALDAIDPLIKLNSEAAYAALKYKDAVLRMKSAVALDCSSNRVAVNQILSHVETYFDFIKAYDCNMAIIEKTQRLQKLHGDTLVHYKKCIGTLETLQTQIPSLKLLLQAKAKSVEIETMLTMLSNLENQVKKIHAIWEHIEPQYQVEEEIIKDIHTCLQLLGKEVKVVNAEYATIKSRYVDLIKAEKEAAEAKQQQVAAQAQSDAVIQANAGKITDAGVVAFFAEKEEALIARKEQLAQLDAQREIEKREKRAAIVAEAKANEKPAVMTETYIDANMEDDIVKMNANYFALLSDIVNKTKGVKFDDVVDLIKLLGGQVEEIGNGSSHKHISLNKLTLEMVVNQGHGEDDVTKATVGSQKGTRKKNKKRGKTTASLSAARSEPTVVDGGFFRQHGGQKTERTLCPFNLGLVQDLFLKAGINQAMLVRLALKRMPDVIIPSTLVCKA